MDAVQHSIEFFELLEKQLHRPEVRQSRGAVEALLADDFIEFGSSGNVYDKQVTIDALCEEAGVSDSPIARTYEYSVREIAPEAVLLTYRSVRVLSTGAERHALRSSIWKHVDGRWQMFFHQGTIVPTSPAGTR